MQNINVMMKKLMTKYKIIVMKIKNKNKMILMIIVVVMIIYQKRLLIKIIFSQIKIYNLNKYL